MLSQKWVRMYLDDLDNPLIFSHYCGNTMVTFKFYSCNNDNVSLLLHFYFFQFRGFERSVVLLLGTTHLFTKRKLILLLKLYDYIM